MRSTSSLRAPVCLRPLAVAAALGASSLAFAARPGGGGGPVGPLFVADPAPARPAGLCPPYAQSALSEGRRDRAPLRVTPADNWASLIQGAAPGTEVVMAPGRYFLGTRQAVVVFDGVTVRGETGDPADVVIYGRGYGTAAEALMIYGDDVTIADVSVTWVRDHAISAKGEMGADRLHVYNVHLYDTGTQHVKATAGTEDGVVACSSIGFNPGNVEGDYINAIDVHGGAGWLIRDNYVYNIWGEGNGCLVTKSCRRYVSGPAILVWNASAGTVIERNEIVDSYRNIALGDGRGHAGGVVRNNVIRRTRAGGDSTIELYTATDTAILHNTVRVPTTDDPALGAVDLRSSTNTRVQNNLSTIRAVWDRGGNAGIVAGGNFDAAADADFAGPDDGHVAPGNPDVVDRGVELLDASGAVSEVPVDFDGEPRVGTDDDGTTRPRFDIGADHDATTAGFPAH